MKQYLHIAVNAPGSGAALTQKKCLTKISLFVMM